MARRAEHQAKRQLRGGIGIAPRGVEHPDAARPGGRVSIFTGFARVQAITCRRGQAAITASVTSS